jgi:hypothetical protein
VLARKPGIALTVTAVVTSIAAFAGPVIREVQPHGAQRGTVVKLQLRGDGLAPGSRIQTSIPGSVARLVGPNSELAFLVELKKDAQPGLYPLRVINEDGISNLMLFSVGLFPEVQEEDAEELIRTPVVVNGTLKPAEIDSYNFNAKAGEKLVFEVEARRMGSAIDPNIEILDRAGKEIAKNEDAPGLGVDSRVEVTFSKTGQYQVKIHDARYSDQVQNFYRLKIGAFHFADAIYPLGGKRGEQVEFTLSGGNLAVPVKVTERLDAKGPFQFVSLPDSAALPFVVAVDDQPDGQELKPGVVVNGRISKPGETGRYKLRVQPGQQWVIDLTAASLGTSRLDGILTVYDEKGKKIASRDDIATADPAVPFTVPEKVNEVTVVVEDVQGRGGPAFGYRLQARQGPPDFVADILSPFVNVPAGGTAQVVVNIQRRGYDGPLRVTIPDLPPGFEVSGGHVPSEAAAQSPFTEGMGYRTARTVLTITALPDAKVQDLELTIVAEADTPTGKIRRQAQGPGLVTVVRGDKQRPFTAAWLGMRLPIAMSSPLPVNLTVPVSEIRISQGFEYQLNYNVKKLGTAKLDKVRDQMAGNVGNMRVLAGDPGKNADTGSVLLASNFSTPVTVFDMLFESQAEIDGRMVSIVAPAVAVHIVAGYDVELASTSMALTPKGKIEIRGTIYREPTFEGDLVKVQAEDLPDNVKCTPVEVPGDQRTFSMTCEAAQNVQPGTYDVRITSVAPAVGRKAKDDYKIQDVNAKLTVRDTERAAR